VQWDKDKICEKILVIEDEPNAPPATILGEKFHPLSAENESESSWRRRKSPTSFFAT
jgi:hypothetical protein